MDVPAHLCQPLSVDTNITYSLDLSKFPGLDDPEQKYIPALLIAQDAYDNTISDTENNQLQLSTGTFHHSMQQANPMSAKGDVTCNALSSEQRHQHLNCYQQTQSSHQSQQLSSQPSHQSQQISSQPSHRSQQVSSHQSQQLSSQPCHQSEHWLLSHHPSHQSQQQVLSHQPSHQSQQISRQSEQLSLQPSHQSQQQLSRQPSHQSQQLSQPNGIATADIMANPQSDSCSKNKLAKYALEAIFKNLIYPDVTKKRQFTLDTLVESAYSETTGRYGTSNFGDTLRQISLNTGTFCNYQLSSNRYGKRKRDIEQMTFNVGGMKRHKFDHVSIAPSKPQPPCRNLTQRRSLVHRRVRELMCHLVS